MSTKNRSRPLEDCTFFIDRSSGAAISSIFEELALPFELHDKHFANTTADVEWIAQCGQEDWAIISSNKAIKNNEMERDAIFKAEVAAFFFTSGDWNTDQKINSLRKALPKMVRLVRQEKRPFIARIQKDGSVELWMNHKRKDLLLNKSNKTKKRSFKLT